MSVPMLARLAHRLAPVVAIAALVAAMGGTWSVPLADADATPGATADVAAGFPGDRRAPKKEVAGKLNLNTATEAQLMMLPTVGPAKAERIVAWRKRNGSFKRTADLRRVKGFGYKTFKRLEPLLAIAGDTTLAAKVAP